MRPIHALACLLGLAWIAAGCARDPSGTGGQDSLQIRTLKYSEECGDAVCGPPSLNACDQICTKDGSDDCAWMSGDSKGSPNGDGTVSWGVCDESECGSPPEPADCPEGFVAGEPACGNLNDQGCAWYVTCLPRRTGRLCERTQCGDAIPEIAVICDDGSIAEWACVETTQGCMLDPVCES